MTGHAGNADGRRGLPWRAIGWSVPVALLLLPLVAGAPWSLSDYVTMGLLFVTIGGAVELAVRASPSLFYRAAAFAAVASAVLLVAINGAVGIIGTEDNGANLLYVGVIGVEIVGAIVAKGRAGGMARALLATAGAQALVGTVALAFGLGASEPPGPFGILVLNAGFVALFLGSAWLFGRAAGPRQNRQHGG